MARPTDPTSQLQVEKRAKWLRSEESGWTESLVLSIALAALKAWQWSHYLENGGVLGPLAGTFPQLPEEPGSWVMVGARRLISKAESSAEAEAAWVRRNQGLAEAELGPFLPSDPQPALSGWPSHGTEGTERTLTSREGSWLLDGQAKGCEVPDTEQLTMAMELASLLYARHLQLLLRPAFYKEAATWIGELLKQLRPETYSPPEINRRTTWLNPKNWEVMGEEVPMDGISALLGAPGSPWAGDLWRVPVYPHGIPSDEALRSHGISDQELALSAACWHFGRVIYRKLLDPRANALGQSGLERPPLLRQLLEELEILKPGGLKTQPVGALARATTNEVTMLGFRALPRPDKWTAAEEDGRGRYLHERSDKNGWRKWEITLQEDRGEIAFASLARCQQVLEKGGLEITALHGLLCCLVMQQEDPSARFEVGGDALLDALGYGQARGGRDGSSRSDLLKKVAQAATLLGAVRCEGGSKNRAQGTRISMEFGPMWSIAVRADGQLKLLEGPGEEQLGTVTDLTLTVTPGTWVQSQRDQATGTHLLYVPMATRVLSLGRYREELAFRLGIHLAMGAREKNQWKAGRANERVGQLLEQILPTGELEKAFQSRDAAHRLRNKWAAALTTLQQVVGFRFEFPLDQYPPALIPEDLRPPDMADPGPVGHGALEKLLASRLLIHWPELVVDAMHQKALPQREKETTRQLRREQRSAIQSRPNGARLKEALEQAKAEGSITGRRQAADRLGMSPSQLSKLENGGKPLSRDELQRCLNLLETLKRRKT